jgi:hypothetical protein
VEHRQVRRVDRFVAIDAAGSDDFDGQRRLALEHARLHGRRVRTEQEIVRQPERVLHVARGMVLGDVERVEVVIRRLDVGAFLEPEPEPAHDGHAGLVNLRERMRRAALLGDAWQRQVLPLGFDLLRDGRGGDPLRRRVELLLDGLLRIIDFFGEPRPLLGGHASEGLERRFDVALLAEELRAQFLDLLGRRGRGELGGELGEGFGGGHIEAHRRIGA